MVGVFPSPSSVAIRTRRVVWAEIAVGGSLPTQSSLELPDTQS